MKNKPPKGKIKQEYILPEIEISSKVVKQSDAKGKPSYMFYKEEPYNEPNPKAKKTTASNVKKIISNSQSSYNMEVDREEKDFLRRYSQKYTPGDDYDYSDFMKSTKRFPSIYGEGSIPTKKLGPMAKLHGGPDNKATGNDKNNTSDPNLNQIASTMVSAGMYGDVGNGRKEKRKADRKEKREINRNTRKTEGTRLGQLIRRKTNKKLTDQEGPLASRQPRGTKEERDSDKFLKKGGKAVNKRDNKVKRLQNKVIKNKITEALYQEKKTKVDRKGQEKLDKAIDKYLKPYDKNL